MIELFFCLLVYVLILFKNKTYLIHCYKLLNPISTMIYVWILVLLCHYCYWGNFENFYISYLMCTIGVLSLTFGFWMNYRSTINVKTSSRVFYNPKFLNKFVRFLVVTELLRFVYYSYVVVYKLAGGMWIALVDDGTALRNLYLSYDANLVEKIFSFSTNLIAYIGYVVIGIYFANKFPKRFVYLGIIILFEIALSVVTMSKLSFSLWVLSFFVSYLNNLDSLYKQKKMLKRFIPAGILLLVSFFLFIGFQRNYMETKGSLEEGVFDGIINYFGGPLQAFDLILDKGLDISSFEHGMIYIGRTYTNVYTWFYYFHLLFPFWGIILFPFILGCLAGRIYKPWKHSFFNDVANSWVCVIIAFSFFDFLLKFTVFSILFVVVWWINKKYSHKLYLYDK